jgi:transcriptional regulator with XRE-family HTH domain
MMRFPAVLLGDKVAVGGSVFGMQSHALSIRLGAAYLRCNGAVQDARKVTVVKGSGNGSQDSGTGEPVRGMKVFAEELRAQRDNRGWTQLELAGELQYSNSFVSDVERAVKVPSSGFAEQCDKAFGLPGTFVRLLEIAKITIYPDYARQWVRARLRARTAPDRGVRPCPDPRDPPRGYWRIHREPCDRADRTAAHIHRGDPH